MKPSSSVQFPARLRLRLRELKGDPVAAGELSAVLRRLPGIVSVEVSPATGSVLLTYHTNGCDEGSFFAALRQVLTAYGQACDRDKVHHAAGRGGPTRLAAMVEKVPEAVLDMLVERSALALFAALL